MNKALLENLGIVLVYLLISLIGEFLAISPGNITPVWIPSGVILAAVLMRGRKILPGIFLGAFFGNICPYFDFENYSNLSTSFFSGSFNGLGDVLAAYIGAHFILKITKTITPFQKEVHVASFIFFGTIVTGFISALFGVSGLSLSGLIPFKDFTSTFSTCWVGNATGVILFSPLILTWKKWKSWDWYHHKILIELFIIGLLLFLVLGLSLNLANFQSHFHLPLVIIIPILLWATFRFPFHITQLLTLISMIFILISSIKGYGPYSGEKLSISLIELQFFFFTVSTTILTLQAHQNDRFKMQESLLESEKYNRILFEESPVGLALCDMEGNLTDVNPEYAKILGRGIEETKRLAYWDITPESYADQEKSQLKSLEETGQYGPYEKDYIHKNKHLIPVRLQGKILKINGQDYIWSSVENISEKKIYEQKLEKSKLSAEKANLAKSEFLSSMSHELRTPLNAIIGQTQFLKMKEDDLTPRQLNSVNEIKNGGEILLYLISDILDLAQVEAGRLIIKKEDIHLNSLLEECRELIDSLLKEKSVTLSFDKMKSTYVYCDAIRLKQIIINFLSNAAKYNVRNGLINISLSHPNDDITRITVADTGIGLTPKQISQLFQPFERLGREREDIEGTGIGLALSKELAELMGGSVGVSAQKDKGSQFWVNVKSSKDGFSQSEDPLDSINLPGNNKDNERLKIKLLYIEDNLANLNLFKQLFSLYEEHYIVHATADPIRGLEIADEELPDIILIDIKMPVMDGFEVLRSLKRNPRTQPIPTLAVSANALPLDIEKALKAGFNEYITKPFNFKTLLKKVEKNIRIKS
jgi:PAS domain S-box-containing protein